MIKLCYKPTIIGSAPSSILINIADSAEHIYIIWDFTDFRKHIESSSTLVSLKSSLDPFTSKYVFLFYNKKRTSIKVLLLDNDGLILVTKNLMEEMKFQWPK